ncbi:hypothetical protein M9H61_17575 [Thalassospira sp. GO-4]|jgi:hypothetical protein|uniref:capsular polysaccharide export protein, LipB/KpsS family n=1 Tax=Thalassospira sp. GO-4 TaxID=2946605 RepID=UPI00202464C0|nr:hypothetical protein [Thalassospira sp. GO-4]URK17343.1 hypothetical protein M9H61_17575 [Thalassospira sp. GO-4]
MRIALLECSTTPWLDIATQLEKVLDAEIVLWTASTGLHEQIANRFPRTHRYSNFDACAGNPPSFLNSSELHHPDSCQNAALFEKFATVLTMMNRWDYDGHRFTYLERNRHVNLLSSIWATILRDLKIDVVIAPTSPHQVYDYITYLLCRANSIPFIFFERTFMLDRLFPLASLEDVAEIIPRSLQLPSHYRNLDADIRSELDRIQDKYDLGKPAYVPNSEMRQATLLSDYKRDVLRLFSAIGGTAFNWKGHQYKTLMKVSRQPLTKKQASGPIALLERLRQIYRMRCRKKTYQRHARLPDLDSHYIYFSLSRQPERTTSPNAGIYADQIIALKELSDAMPAGWKLYVKENPRQFTSKTRAHHLGTYRDEQFYTEIRNLKNVEFIPLTSDPFVLIDNAKAVATTTGSVGWEALVRGKPAIIFAPTWYSNCPGAYKVSEAQNAPSIIAELTLKNWEGPTRENVEQFASGISLICEKAFIDTDMEKFSNIDRKKNSQNIAKMVELTLKTFNNKKQ